MLSGFFKYIFWRELMFERVTMERWTQTANIYQFYKATNDCVLLQKNVSISRLRRDLESTK